MTDPKDWILLQSGPLSAAIDPLGAQLSQLRDAAGKDLLWNGDPDFWNGRSPLLFPIVGSLNGGVYRWKGAQYALPRHGLARVRLFEVLRHDAQQAWFRLTSDETTRAAYPFDFELDACYRLEGPSLSIELRVRNTGDTVLPASCGFHPAFRWPLPYGEPREAHALEFEHGQSSPVRRLDHHGLLLAEGRPTPLAGRLLPLDDALFVDDVVIFDALQSRSLTYGAGLAPKLRLSFDGATHLGLWTKPGAGFICIEPWRGVADPVGFDGEIDSKPGVFLVAPGSTASFGMRVEWLPGSAGILGDSPFRPGVT